MLFKWPFLLSKYLVFLSLHSRIFLSHTWPFPQFLWHSPSFSFCLSQIPESIITTVSTSLFSYSMTLRFLLLSRLTDKGHNYLIITNPIYFFNLYVYYVKFTIFNFRATIFFWLPSSLSDLSFSAIYHFPPTNFWMKIFLNFYVLASVIFFLHWTLLCSRPIYLTWLLTIQWTTS